MDGARAALAAGLRALEQARWDQARECLQVVLAHGASAPAHDGLGLALWFLGEVPEAVAERERAFELYAAGGRPDEAARCAVWVSHQHALGGRASAARGWLARAERVVDGLPADGAGHGWVAVERARHATTGEERSRWAARAVDLAQRAADPDLEVFALSLLGRTEVAAGHEQRGVALLEEAMAAAAAGRVRNAHTLGEAYCNLVTACADTGDWERATEWCERVDAFAREHRAAPLVGACRTVHAEVLLATGHWREAEAELTGALAVHATTLPDLSGPAAAALAELRVRQGRPAEAEQLLTGREETPSALRALALVRLAQRRPDEAVVLLRRGLAASQGDAVRSGRLLATLVEALLACGDAAAAADGVRRLVAGARADGRRVSGARAALAQARLQHASGRPAAAAEPAALALADFLVLAMPVDAAEARLELARSLALTAPAAAADEASVAARVLRESGATVAAASAAALLERVRRPRGKASGGLAGLTDREREVLALVARGLTNAQIAQSLVISEKTVGHHVSHILTKLGARNRTEAAGHLARPSP